MGELADTLIHLLDGDFVRLVTGEEAVTAEVVGHDREARETPDGREWRYVVRFMPVGEDATEVGADRYRVVVESADGGWDVGDLHAEVFDDEALEYDLEPRGRLVEVEVLGSP